MKKVKAKYKVGDQKVLMVEDCGEDYGAGYYGTHWNCYPECIDQYQFSGAYICEEAPILREAHGIYLVCDEENFEVGQLIVAECVHYDNNDHEYSVWKRLEDELTKSMPIKIKPKNGRRNVSKTK